MAVSALKNKAARLAMVTTTAGFMVGLAFLNGGTVYVEIRQRALRILHGEESLVIRIEREQSGRLTAGCKENVSAGLRTLLKKKSWQPRAQAFCAIEARGVSLRRLSLPVSASTDPQRMLRLQIESEFPLPPEALAWGYSQTDAKPEQRPHTPSFAGPTEGRPALSPSAVEREKTGRNMGPVSQISLSKPYVSLNFGRPFAGGCKNYSDLL